MGHHRERHDGGDYPTSSRHHPSVARHDGGDTLFAVGVASEWTIHHRAVVDGVVRPVAADAADYRIFTQFLGGFRRYDLHANESRALTAELLQRQLDRSIAMHARPDGSLEPYAEGRIERRATPDGSVRTYFTDPDGVVWRVLDTTFGPPDGPPRHAIHFPPPHAAAKNRIFITATGTARIFTFDNHHAVGEARRPLLTARVVSEQLRCASWPADTLEEEAERARRDPTWRRSAIPGDRDIRPHTATYNRWTAFDAP